MGVVHIGKKGIIEKCEGRQVNIGNFRIFLNAPFATIIVIVDPAFNDRLREGR